MASIARGKSLEESVKSGCIRAGGVFLWGRDLLVQGLRCRVGNRNKISVFQNQWIPNAFGIKLPKLVDQNFHSGLIGPVLTG